MSHPPVRARRRATRRALHAAARRAVPALVMAGLLATFASPARPAPAGAPGTAPAATPAAAAPASAPDSTAPPAASAGTSVMPAGGVTPGGATPDSAVAAPPVDYLWVVRGTLADSAEVVRMVERAKAMGVRGLLVQVVGRGDAWYRSDLLPRPEAMAGSARDPLGELLPLAHAAGLEVHAWMNCCLVWSAPNPPRDPRHVLHEHPEWVARMRDGRPMTRLTRRECERLHVEGVFLSPGHPGVRTWVARIAREIASRYPVDGIHLDYIRQPAVPIGYDPTSRAQFALREGADPAAFDRLPAPERARLDSAWTRFQQDQVTAIVREVRDSVEAVRPGLPISAAVVADTVRATRQNRQAWMDWLRSGLLDRAYAMCYAPALQTVLDQLTSMSEQVGTARLVPGIAVYNTPPSTAAAKIKGARALGFPAIALYSYDSLWERGDGWQRLLQYLDAPPSLLEATP